MILSFYKNLVSHKLENIFECELWRGSLRKTSCQSDPIHLAVIRLVDLFLVTQHMEETTCAFTKYN